MKADPTLETMEEAFQEAMSSDMWTDEQKTQLKKEYEEMLEKINQKK